ncbi:MAG: hypothetical protein ACT4P1_13155 [Sporichthyaceae bacterium]
MGRGGAADKRDRGSFEKLPSGRLRVMVFTGYDPVSKRRHYVSELAPKQLTEAATLREAEKTRTRLLNRVDEQRSWVPESDRKAANVLAGQVPLRPG